MQQNLFVEWAEIVLVLVLFGAIVVSLVVWSVKNGISPMPTTSKAKSAMLSLLPSELQGNIYDLGSGWGTLILSMAKKYPSCRVIGFETSLLPFWVSKLRLALHRVSNAEIIREDFFFSDLRDASLIVCYLYPGAMRKLKTKFEEELSSGTLIISNTFAIPVWTPGQIVEIDDLYRTKIYLYRKLSSKTVSTNAERQT